MPDSGKMFGKQSSALLFLCSYSQRTNDCSFFKSALILLHQLVGFYRWVKKHKFFDSEGKEKKLWEIARGKKYRAHKLIFDTTTGEKMPCDLWWGQVWHASYAEPLYVLKIRLKKEIGYLITNELVKTEKQAWDIFFIYKRRWQIETSFRYGKCELAMESPRLWFFENRLKLLSIVTIVYSFLLYLISPIFKDLVELILRLKCHRTGKRCREVTAPLYRLRWAISRLWDDSHPALGRLFPPNVETIRVLAAQSREIGSPNFRYRWETLKSACKRNRS